jgi:hypothetical protein
MRAVQSAQDGRAQASRKDWKVVTRSNARLLAATQVSIEVPVNCFNCPVSEVSANWLTSETLRSVHVASKGRRKSSKPFPGHFYAIMSTSKRTVIVQETSCAWEVQEDAGRMSGNGESKRDKTTLRKLGNSKPFQSCDSTIMVSFHTFIISTDA